VPASRTRAERPLHLPRLGPEEPGDAIWSAPAGGCGAMSPSLQWQTEGGATDAQRQAYEAMVLAVAEQPAAPT